MVLDSVPFSYQLDDINNTIALTAKYQSEQARLGLQKHKIQRNKQAQQMINYAPSQGFNRPRHAPQGFQSSFEKMNPLVGSSTTPSPVSGSNSDLLFMSLADQQQLAQLGPVAPQLAHSSTVSSLSSGKDQVSSPMRAGSTGSTISSGSSNSPWNTSLLDTNTKSNIPFSSTWSQVW
ncbi:hypothetical protein OGATHE_004608 [Ogataea polymorpha]|uniref:Uncharacterized protein n=1 Tax=Ogataea polymorpha TaxID=460523 RepID=A0A9P8P0M0_9ASCO|nr:hypothetical protein OGATHE_004608 [Ogataea polymorpha]